MVWPSKVRRGRYKHAFEDALDEASLDADGNPILSDDDEKRVSGPMVGSLGDISIASGYVAQASLARAYEAEGEDEADAELPGEPVVAPGEAARTMKLALEAKEHTSAELRKMRRRFAAANHPDRVEAPLRDEAVAAMADINAAIDRALLKQARTVHETEGPAKDRKPARDRSR
ncbi:hypothetical protein [Hyphomicrobium sp.]|uniref:hypothetical protein n=1 Tax=Hyphomicrobium sp. TaxID=82 RepID=UPI003F6F5C22